MSVCIEKCWQLANRTFVRIPMHRVAREASAGSLRGAGLESFHKKDPNGETSTVQSDGRIETLGCAKGEVVKQNAASVV